MPVKCSDCAYFEPRNASVGRKFSVGACFAKYKGGGKRTSVSGKKKRTIDQLEEVEEE